MIVMNSLDDSLLSEVTRLHIEYIKSGFMSQLGERFLKNCKLTIIKSFLKLFFTPMKILKFFESYKYASLESIKITTNSELISIVVKQGCRNKGIAKALYKSLIHFFKREKVKKFKILVGSNLKEAQKFYEKMGAEKIGEIEIHKGVKSFLYIHNIEE